MAAIPETDLKDWRINVPNPAGVCTEGESDAVKAYEITLDMIDPHYVDNADLEKNKRTRERERERLSLDGHRNFADSAMEGVHTELFPTSYDNTNWKRIEGDEDTRDNPNRVQNRVKKNLDSPEGQSKSWGATTMPHRGK